VDQTPPEEKAPATFTRPYVRPARVAQAPLASLLFGGGNDDQPEPEPERERRPARHRRPGPAVSGPGLPIR
jgi:hypothetical protein